MGGANAGRDSRKTNGKERTKVPSGVVGTLAVSAPFLHNLGLDVAPAARRGLVEGGG